MGLKSRTARKAESSASGNDAAGALLINTRLHGGVRKGNGQSGGGLGILIFILSIGTEGK